VTGRQRLSARDYKHGSRRSPLSRFDFRQFGTGLALGLVVALGVYVIDHRARPTESEVQPKPHNSKQTAAAGDNVAGAEDPAAKYDFYDMLPKFEVVVPEKERAVRGNLPSVPVERPGAYVLQAGSYRDQAEAERLRAKLAKQGVDAIVQRVAVDADVWHRVRIGPFRDLTKLNDTRRALRAADVDAIVIRLPD
jgi:cell division protein FtsN